MGVAPPDMQTAVNAAKETVAAKQKHGEAATGGRQPAGRPKSPAQETGEIDLGKTMVGRASPDDAPVPARRHDAQQRSPEAASQSDVNAFGGTMVGTSPFANADFAATTTSNTTSEAATGDAGTRSVTAIAETTPPKRTPGFDDSPGQTGASDQTGAMAAAPRSDQAHTGPGRPSASSFDETFQSDAPSAPPTSPQAQLRSPIASDALTNTTTDISEKKPGAPIVLLIVAILVVGALTVLTLTLGTGEAEQEKEEMEGADQTEETQTLKRK